MITVALRLLSGFGLALSLSEWKQCWSLLETLVCITNLTMEDLQSSLEFSGVQRFFDARGQRGSWMPEAGQIPKFLRKFTFPKINLFCPKTFSTCLPTFWRPRPFFSHLPKNFKVSISKRAVLCLVWIVYRGPAFFSFYRCTIDI